MKKAILIPIALAVLIVSSCSTVSKSHSSPLEGSWSGRENTPGHQGTASLTFTGQTLQFHGTDADDWADGTFILHENTNPKQLVGVITNCSSGETIGKTVYAIYKIEADTLTLSGNSPGNLNIPAAFDTPGTRQFVLKHAE